MAAAAGDSKTALALPDTRGDPLVTDVAKVDQALLLEHRRSYAEADAAFKALLADTGGASIDSISYGGFLERRGRKAEEAKAVYVAALKGEPDNSLLQLAARDRVVAGGRPAASAHPGSGRVPGAAGARRRLFRRTPAGARPHLPAPGAAPETHPR